MAVPLPRPRLTTPNSILTLTMNFSKNWTRIKKLLQKPTLLRHRSCRSSLISWWKISISAQLEKSRFAVTMLKNWLGDHRLGVLIVSSIATGILLLLFPLFIDFLFQNEKKGVFLLVLSEWERYWHVFLVCLVSDNAFTCWWIWNFCCVTIDPVRDSFACVEFFFLFFFFLHS